jgi:TRAP-type C4-dicarboxylate transport system permease small subunit
MKCPKHLQELLNSIVALFGMGLSILIIWQSLLYGRTLQAGAEISPTAKFPIYPFAYGIAVSFFPMFLAFLSQFISSMKNILFKIRNRGV